MRDDLIADDAVVDAAVARPLVDDVGEAAVEVDDDQLRGCARAAVVRHLREHELLAAAREQVLEPNRADRHLRVRVEQRGCVRSSGRGEKPGPRIARVRGDVERVRRHSLGVEIEAPLLARRVPGENLEVFRMEPCRPRDGTHRGDDRVGHLAAGEPRPPHMQQVVVRGQRLRVRRCRDGGTPEQPVGVSSSRRSPRALSARGPRATWLYATHTEGISLWRGCPVLSARARRTEARHGPGLTAS